MATKSPSVHTTPNKNGDGWTNTSDGQTLGTYATQAEASEAGRAHAQSTRAEHHVHGRNGQIRESNSYGNDPESILG